MLENNSIYNKYGKVRTRFAPSPTGPLHIGGVRTALYNYLFAKKYQGDCILRIEDTDKLRYVEGSEIYIYDSLSWLGIEFDESPIKSGKYGPYKQSERKCYLEYAQSLVSKGYAYYAFDTPEELNKCRQDAKKAAKVNWKYDRFNRMDMKNSLTLSEQEVKRRIYDKQSYTIRIKMDTSDIKLFDLIRGWIVFASKDLDDKVLIKEDGTPTYHFANVVDDHLMRITHVIRGEEWLPSAPLHFYLYDVLGWDKPQFAHLPLILSPDGKGKLSKRDASKYDIPVFPIDWSKGEDVYRGYREEGFLPEALKNILALLGWSPGDNKEVMTADELQNLFSLDKVNKSPAKFDYKKALWINHKHIQMADNQKLADNIKQINKYEKKIVKAIELCKGSCHTLKELEQKVSVYYPDITNDNINKISEHKNNMRTITLYSTRYGVKSIETEAQTWGDFKHKVEETGFRTEGFALLIGISKTLITSNDSVLPNENFVLYFLPEKTKAGADPYTLKELEKEISCYYSPPQYDDISRILPQKDNIAKLNKHFKQLDKFDIDKLQKLLEKFIKDNNLKFFQIALPLRIILTGSPKGPSIVEVMNLLDKDEVIKRIDFVLDKL